MNRIEKNEIHQAIEVPIALQHSGNAGTIYQPTPDFKAIFNINEDKIAAIVSSDYTLIQHRDIYETFEVTLKNLNIPFATKIYKGDNNLIFDVEFPEMKKLVTVGEEFILGFRVINSYNKTTGFTIIPRVVRLACNNGMCVGIDNEIRFNIRHNSKLAIDIPLAVNKAMTEVLNISEKLNTWVNSCMNDSAGWEVASQILDELLGKDSHKKIKDKVFKELGIARIEVELADGKTLTRFVNDNAEQVQLTRWKIYNAITSVATHNDKVKPAMESYLQRKAQKILTTQLATLQVAQVM